MDLNSICKIVDSIHESTSELEKIVKAEKGWLHGHIADTMSANNPPYEIRETEDDHHYFLEVYANLPDGRQVYQSAIRIEKKIYK